MPGRLSLGFAGGVYGADIGLVSFRARDYDPQGPVSPSGGC